MTQTETDVFHILLPDCNGKTYLFKFNLQNISKISVKTDILGNQVYGYRYMFNCVLKNVYEITIFSETFLYLE